MLDCRAPGPKTVVYIRKKLPSDLHAVLLITAEPGVAATCRRSGISDGKTADARKTHSYTTDQRQPAKKFHDRSACRDGDASFGRGGSAMLPEKARGHIDPGMSMAHHRKDQAYESP